MSRAFLILLAAIAATTVFVVFANLMFAHH
jgi:hypothetical protein